MRSVSAMCVCVCVCLTAKLHLYEKNNWLLVLDLELIIRLLPL